MIYYFAPCAFDDERGEVRRAGEVVRLEPQGLAVLRYLLANRERVVSRDELLEQCWSESYVSDGALSRCLSRLRQALGHDRRASPIIETVHRRGYCFVAQVRETAERTAPGPASSEPSALAPELLANHGPPSEPPQAGADPPTASLSSPSEPVFPPAPTPMAERRSLSVLSCILTESDRLFQHLDAEDYYDLMQTFHATCVERVVPYEGHVSQPSDAGLLVYFGYPHAHDDAAQRAVHSGLAIAEAVRHGALDAWALPGTPQAVRVGIATGMMIVSADSAPAVALALGVGSASSLAPRLAALAPPGGVVISEATMRLVSGYFECKALEDVRLADTASAVVYEVRGVSSLQTRLEVESAHGLTPFVGREAEVALFADRWTSVREGLGQVMWVQGESGMGKSRLVQVVKEQLAGEGAMAWECRCSPYHQHTALYPVIDLM
jgi:DNA-binding winged helix-turn-helix (wHTH) protein